MAINTSNVDVVVGTGLAWAVWGAHWRSPKKWWVKLNTKCELSKNNNTVAIGGVFGDHDANWMCGFAMRIGNDSIFKTKVRAILEGLNLA
ncbi:hypothetical protein J1N35_016844 [Gossypium stocksii]|uniref:RNase H type-1 domain-containing protein n=1 Tax=Gossypium stocksii TaxID=47602 RepID=A0A9D4A3H8_9ROSI|nr:hypothetical protein J1N35_016844 [Gossypium stocksii]